MSTGRNDQIEGPERIWITNETNWISFSRYGASSLEHEDCPEYVRADLYEAQLAGHRLSAKQSTENLIRATAAEATVAALRQALEDILAPIAKAQRELEPGQRLNGNAYSILTSAENLREIARAALQKGTDNAINTDA